MIEDVRRVEGRLTKEREARADRFGAGAELLRELLQGLVAGADAFGSVAAGHAVEGGVAGDVAALERGEDPEPAPQDGERDCCDATATELGEGATIVGVAAVGDFAVADTDFGASREREEANEVAPYFQLFTVSDPAPRTLEAIGEVREALAAEEDVGDVFGREDGACGIRGHLSSVDARCPAWTAQVNRNFGF